MADCVSFWGFGCCRVRVWVRMLWLVLESWFFRFLVCWYNIVLWTFGGFRVVQFGRRWFCNLWGWMVLFDVIGVCGVCDLGLT